MQIKWSNIRERVKVIFISTEGPTSSPVFRLNRQFSKKKSQSLKTDNLQFFQNLRNSLCHLTPGNIFSVFLKPNH